MTDSDHALTARTGTAGRPDGAAVRRIALRLARAYPEFTFGYQVVSRRKGPRWVAERRDRKAPARGS